MARKHLKSRMAELDVNPVTVADAIYSRRSVRSYTADPVDETHVRALLQAAVQAPTAMRAEPWLFVVVQDRAALKRYSDVAKVTMLKDAQLYRDLHDPSLTPKNGGFLKALGSPDFNIFYNAGTLILICCRSTNPFVTADCWLAAQNLMLAASAMGLGTCCIGSALPAAQSPERRLPVYPLYIHHRAGAGCASYERRDVGAPSDARQRPATSRARRLLR